MRDVLFILSAEGGIILQLQIRMKMDNAPRSKSHSSIKNRTTSGLLSVIVYGPMYLFEHVGEFFQENNLYLQDPINCEYNVQYRNPHLLSGLDNEAQWTFDLDTPLAEYEEIETMPDLLDGLQTDEVLPETETPPNIATPLYR